MMKMEAVAVVVDPGDKDFRMVLKDHFN